MGFRRFRKSAFRKGRRLYRYARANPKQALALARSAWKGVQTIRGLVNSEMFHKDAQYTLGSAQTRIYHLTTLTQGDAVSGRTGNSILLKSFSANGYMYVHPSQTTNTRVMLALILDKQQVEDTYPTLANIFANDTTPNTLLNSSNLGRFKVLWRRQYTLDSNAGGGNNAKQIKIFKRLNFHVRYNGAAETDIAKNGVYLCMITSEPSLYPTIDFQSRINYHDN